MTKGVLLQKEKREADGKFHERVSFCISLVSRLERRMNCERKTNKTLSFSFVCLFSQPGSVLVILNFHASELLHRCAVGAVVMAFGWFGVDGSLVWS